MNGDAGVQPEPHGEKLMNAPTPATAADTSIAAESIVETEIGNLVKTLGKQESAKLAPQIENDAARIKSAVGRLTSSSINELRGLTSELEELQQFLKSEVDRVERDIESALAGINIIIETIAPWKGTADSLTPPNGARSVRGGPAANIASGSRGPE